MARLAAKERVLFYPTPLEIVETIASNIICPVTSPDERVGTICDPCCGTGEPLALLGNHLGLTTYGNEIHPERYGVARSRLDHCLNGAREFLNVEGRFNVILNNPPYDQELGGQRMEVSHIRADLDLLLPGGLGLWVIPETIIDFDLCHLLVIHLKQVNIRRFPMPEYERFKQVVIFGLKRHSSPTYTHTTALELEKLVKNGPPVLQANEFAYSFTNIVEPITVFEVKFPEAATILEEIEDHGLHHADAWQSLMGSQGQTLNAFQPILPLSSGHTAMAIAAGIVDGTEVVIDDQTHLIKGSTTKRLKVSQEVEPVEDGAETTIREREQLVQVITALNLEDGTLSSYNSLDDKDGFADFLLTHQEVLVQTIEQNFPPLFDPQTDMDRWLPQLAKVQAPGKLPGQTTIGGLLPAQQVRAAALAERLRDKNSVILIGEMGVGKSATSLALASLIGKGDNWKLVIVAPAQVAPKWAREARTVLARFKVSVHLIGEKRKQADGQGKRRKVAKPVLDAIRAMEEPGPSILVMSFETAKNGNRWQHALAYQRKVLRYTVEVEEPIAQYPYRQVVEKIVTKVEPVLCCPDCGTVLRDEYGSPLREIKEMGKRKRQCSMCGAALWSQIPFAYGGRMAIADLLNRRYGRQYNLIIDECHSAKGGATDIGQAAMDLIAGAKKVVAMTGTAYAGKASSIFYLLFRLLPSFRDLYGPTEVQRFIEAYGLQETITKVKSYNQYHSTYGYNRENVRVKEIPGVAPGMVTMLLEHTAFLKLADVGFVLPPYTEERLPVPLDDRLEDGLDDLARIYEDAVKLAREGQPGLLSAWLFASLAWVDCPVTDTLVVKNEEGEVTKTYTIDGALVAPDEIWEDPLAKDEVLVDLIEAEIAQGRGVGVYFAQVNRRDWMGRVQKLLEQRGIYAEILRQSTCKAADRESWYRKFVARCRGKGQAPVLLLNGSLVKEGLDLVELPTLIETGIEYKINDLRQRDRRSWRLIQDRPVKVVFLYYEGSFQETALKLVAAKLKAAHMVDGNLADGLAAMDMDDGNLMDALMKAVASKDRQPVEWSGMQIASIEQVTESPQVPLLPEVPQETHTELELVEVQMSGEAAQLSWGELSETQVEPERLKKPRPKTGETPKIEYSKISTKGGGEQYSFL